MSFVALVRRTCLFVALLALTSAGLAAPAQAGAGAVDCTGFTACGKKHSSQGWYKAYKKSYWAQSKGHNCTNYVAYRLTHNGRVTLKVPGFATASGWDDAVATWATWGATKVSGTPQVGDVAYWDARVNGASASGHVAYVEEVDAVDPSKVLVSEDNKGGTYRWVRLDASSRPSGYLRFAPASPTPYGQVTSAVSPAANQVKVSGYATDPDSFAKGVKLRVTVYDTTGKPFTFTTSKAVPHRFVTSFSSSSMPNGNLTVETRALNVPGTPGDAWALIDTQTVAVK